MFASYKFQRSLPTPASFLFLFESVATPSFVFLLFYISFRFPRSRIRFASPLFFISSARQGSFWFFFSSFLRIFLVSLFSPSQLHFFYTQTIFGSLFLLRIPAKSFEVTERKMVFRKNIEQPRSEETRDVRMDGGVVLYFEV